jgi:hypothetical protein
MTRTVTQKGSVLLVAMLVVVVLSGLALVLVHNVQMEWSNLGAHRMAKQGYYVTEAGLTGPIAQAAKDQDAFLGFLQGSHFTVGPEAISQQFFDHSPGGSFGLSLPAGGAGFFQTYFTDPVDTQQIPGYSLGGFCFRRYTVVSDGFLGKGAVDPENPESVLHTSQSRFVSHLYLGPFQCGY